MTACGSLNHFFEKPLPENPTLLESLATWNQIMASKAIEPSSLTEIFGELHFEEKPKSPEHSSSPSKTLVEGNQHSNIEKTNQTTNSSLDALLGLSKSQYNSSRTKNSGSSLQLCTEGLGFESSDDVENFISMEVDGYCSDRENEKLGVEKHRGDALRRGLERCWDNTGAGGGFKRSMPAGKFPPPPITSIMGRQGKPSFFLKSYRQDGRFVLREFKVPSQEFLHACREDGRLKLNFIVPDIKSTEYGEENGARKEHEKEEIGTDESSVKVENTAPCQKGKRGRNRLLSSTKMSKLHIAHALHVECLIMTEPCNPFMSM